MSGNVLGDIPDVETITTMKMEMKVKLLAKVRAKVTERPVRHSIQRG